MGAPTLEIRDARSGEAVVQDAVGVYLVRDQCRYVVRSERPLVAHGEVLQVQPVGDKLFGSLFFENYVGLAEIGGIRFRVQHSKLTEEVFASMLDGVVSAVADLAFNFSSPTALPFERDDLGASDEVRYHALAYLRHVMRRAEDRLLGQFLQIARHPHRRIEHEARWMPVGRAASVGACGLLAIAGHPERLVPLSLGSKLAETGLGRRLGRLRPLFPAEVLVTDHAEGFDTHENRLVLHVLRLASDIIGAFEGRKLTNPDLGADLRVMREEIDWMLSFDFLGNVGPMQLVPSQSSVLQRREGYREFLGHFICLSQSSVLAENRHRWHALLDLKDSALLYELWCFFEVKRILDGMLGKPADASLVDSNEKSRNVRWAANIAYQGGAVELFYNLTYSRRSGSYSVMLRPDIVVRVRRAHQKYEVLILDAKLKFDGAKLANGEDKDLDSWERAAKKEDLYKMHTYRDAIRDAVGAFVLFPGSKLVTYREELDGPRWIGIGAIPLEPGKPAGELQDLLADFLELPATAP